MKLLLFTHSDINSFDDVSSGYSSTVDLSRSELSPSKLKKGSSNASLHSKKAGRDLMSLPRRRVSEKPKVQRATT